MPQRVASSGARDDRQARLESGDALYRRLKWMQPLSFVAIAGALVVAATVVGNPWSWPLFAWGMAIGVVGAMYTEVSLRLLSRRPEVKQSDRDRVKIRRPIYAMSWLGSGAIIGGSASITGQSWIDLVGAVYAALVIVAGMVVFAVARRHIQRQVK